MKGNPFHFIAMSWEESVLRENQGIGLRRSRIRLGPSIMSQIGNTTLNLVCLTKDKLDT